jgi:hypothetical protein
MLLLILHNERDLETAIAFAIRIHHLRLRWCHFLENHSVLEIMIFVSQVGTVAHKTFSYSEAAYSCSLQAAKSSC